jgi:hypothetical protein
MTSGLSHKKQLFSQRDSKLGSSGANDSGSSSKIVTSKYGMSGTRSGLGTASGTNTFKKTRNSA